MSDQIDPPDVAVQDVPATPYDVGYGKPPTDWKWKKGQSGNPSGKKKGTKSFKKMFVNTAAMKVPVKDAAGNVTKKPIIEVVVDAAFKQAVNGKQKFVPIALKLVQEFCVTDDAPELKEGEIFKNGPRAYVRTWFTQEDVDAIEQLRFLDPRTANGEIELIDLETDPTDDNN